MDRFQKHDLDWNRAYEKLSKISGLLLEEIYSRSFIIVKDKNSRYCGLLGVVESSRFGNNFYSYIVRYAGIKRRVKLDISFDPTSKLDERLFFEGPNVFLVLEELSKIEEKKRYPLLANQL